MYSGPGAAYGLPAIYLSVSQLRSLVSDVGVYAELTILDGVLTVRENVYGRMRPTDCAEPAGGAVGVVVCTILLAKYGAAAAPKSPTPFVILPLPSAANAAFGLSNAYLAPALNLSKTDEFCIAFCLASSDSAAVAPSVAAAAFPILSVPMLPNELPIELAPYAPSPAIKPFCKLPVIKAFAPPTSKPVPAAPPIPKMLSPAPGIK